MKIILIAISLLMFSGIDIAHAQQKPKCSDSQLLYPKHPKADSNGCVPLTLLNKESQERRSGDSKAQCAWSQAQCGQGACPDGYYVRSVKMEQGQNCTALSAYCCKLP